jgi:ABC-type transporter Mla MlaB component
MTDPLSSVARLRLDGALTVRGVASVHADLAAALDQHAMVIVDCSAATEVDLSLIQLLLAARRSAQHADKTLRLVGADNTALRTALARGGFLPSDPDGDPDGDPDRDPGGDPGAVGPDAEFWLGTTETA